MNASTFVRALMSLRLENVFNPYSMLCPVCDTMDAPRRRARTLEQILEAATCIELDSLWVGRDLGYRGGRRSGLALTDDVHVVVHARRWGVSAERFTRGDAIAERTAGTIWSVLSTIEAPVFLWNVFPLHPHEMDEPFSNRAHNAAERKIGEELLSALLSLLRPRRLVTLGLSARETAARLYDGEIVTLRHPSYGGRSIFLRQVQQLYA